MTPTFPLRVVAPMLALGVLLAGCTSGGGSPTETPSVSAPRSATPSASSPTATGTSASPAASTASSVSGSPTMVSGSPDAALVKEALALNQKEFDVVSALERSGVPRGTRPKSITDIMLPGDGLEARLNILWKVWEDGAHATSNSRQRMSGTKLADDPDGALVAVSSCRDASQWTFEYPDGSTKTGTFARYVVYVKRDSAGELKVSDWSSERVKSCV
ncbi:hypothetical protein [Aestuariimicrobium sp. T2.26MG-19.2B]|uniref:hypothetical protein n=1 Tax=Aestuariimicrobium sp. T2.26MG-19.2B TaxID=3040679 RepID=UPI002477C3A4|nr:hypothetical protein [Aestuariimicrobium sp. T2.26MG-19.2B]CAI9410605.1 hypothetical protein AESSP_02473 [Aestuariimicrobium sp. T2.26MG-19.2B]